MAQYNFEGDLSGLSDRQLEFINDVILQQGFDVDKVTFEAVGEAGDNYASSVKRIKVEGEETISMIAKIAPTVEAIRNGINTCILFKNEHIMYTSVLPKMLDLQIKANVPLDERLKFAKCYGSLSEQPNEVIILEDLKESGYVMEDRFKTLSDVCVRKVLKNFAVLHSLSFVLKKEDPEAYNSYKDNLTDFWASMDTPDFKLYFEAINSDVVSVLEKEEHINALKDRTIGLPSLAAEMTKLEYDNPYSVIQQGDSWTNNIMFRYPDSNTVESIMIDYQIANNSNAAYDIMYMLFNCTDHKARSEHFHDWMDHYHKELDKSLSNFDMEANSVYPKAQLNADLKRYGKLMLGISLLLAITLIKKNEDAAKVKESMEVMNNLSEEKLAEMTEAMKIANTDEETRTRFRNRVVGLASSFIEFDLL